MLKKWKRVDDDDDDDDEVVKDGRRVRVPLMMMDAASGQDADAMARAFRLSRPGFRTAADADAVARDGQQQPTASELAYRKMVADSAAAWRTPERVAQDAEQAAELGRDQHMIADADAQARREQAWQRSVATMCSAWKTAT